MNVYILITDHGDHERNIQAFADEGSALIEESRIHEEDGYDHESCATEIVTMPIHILTENGREEYCGGETK